MMDLPSRYKNDIKKEKKKKTFNIRLKKKSSF